MAMRGNIPPTFNGSRKDAKDFMYHFGNWKFLNRDTLTVQVGADLVAFCLTCIQGPLTKKWARGISDQLCRKVIGDPARHIPPTHAAADMALWDWFVTEFYKQFTDHAEVEDAYAQLQKIEMKDYDADSYINKFIELAEAAQWHLDAAGTISAFRDGLPVNIHRAAALTAPMDMEQWFEAVRTQVRLWKDLNNRIGPKGGPGTISTRQNKLRLPKPSPKPKNRDPDAMDINTIKTGKLTEEEKTKLSKEGHCFRCKKLGHISRNCSDKGKNYKPRNESGQYVRDKPKARVTEVEEPQENEVEEEPKEKPPAYTEKGIMEFIRTMKADKREALYEAMSLQAEDF
jgi:hypothetical protein